MYEIVLKRNLSDMMCCDDVQNKQFGFSFENCDCCLVDKLSYIRKMHIVQIVNRLFLHNLFMTVTPHVNQANTYACCSVAVLDIPAVSDVAPWDDSTSFVLSMVMRTPPLSSLPPIVIIFVRRLLLFIVVVTLLLHNVVDCESEYTQIHVLGSYT